MTGKEITLDS